MASGRRYSLRRAPRRRLPLFAARGHHLLNTETTPLMTRPAPAASAPRLPRRAAITVFVAFAGAYFISALLRAVTATLSPVLTAEFGLHGRDLGLLAGGYFLGFAAMQLPLGAWLDRHGPRRVELLLLTVAVAGCALFAAAGGFAALLAARVLMGVGVAACLMAALTGYRRWFDAAAQLRANAWMLMTGSLGMLASTLPVQWLLPMACIALAVPPWQNAPPPAGPAAQAAPAASRMGAAGQADQTQQAHQTAPRAPTASGGAGASGYAAIWRHPFLRRAVPLGAISYGGMVAVQTLWAGPWLTRVAGCTPAQAAAGLFGINAAMLLTFWGWGLLLPRLAARGLPIGRLVARVQVFSFPALAALLLAGPAGGAASFVLLALYCVLTTPAAHLQAAVGMSFAAAQAGRALSAFNLVIFTGVFVVQWSIGLATDTLQTLGLTPANALRGALAAFGLASLLCWLHFVRAECIKKDSEI